MPLAKGSSNETFENNVSEMVKAGHPINQALAAAYSKQRESSDSDGRGIAVIVKELADSLAVLVRLVGRDRE